MVRGVVVVCDGSWGVSGGAAGTCDLGGLKIDGKNWEWMEGGFRREWEGNLGRKGKDGDFRVVYL